MRIPAFEDFSEDEQKRLFVQKAVNDFKKKENYPHHAKTYFLTNYTLSGIGSFYSYHLYKKNINPDLEFCDFDAITQTLLNKESRLYSFAPNFIVFSLDLRILIKSFYLNEWSTEQVFEEVIDLLSLTKNSVKAPILVTDFIVPFLPVRREVGQDLEYKVKTLNSKLASFIQENSRDYFHLELNKLASFLGYNSSIDERLWKTSKAPYKSPLLSFLAKDISTIIGAHFGLSKKCIILDCDNTLWGGVIGEDGLEGIALDPYTYPGSAFYEFQTYLINKHKEGILLAICSKNNESDVLKVLSEHPHCLLKHEHFVTIKANWNVKSQNILEISKELSLGVRNFVFIDDSDVECNLTQDFLPELDIIQAPKAPSDFMKIWNSENIFLTPYKTKEDEQKQKQYKENLSRQKDAEKFSDISLFLKSLNMSVKIYKDEASQLERIAQLTQKTNQFNLRTKRYSVNTVEEYLKSDKSIVFSMHVSDKFGDLGITNVAIFHLENGEAMLDTFLMSCRVIQRDLEFYFLNYCAQYIAKEYKIKKLNAEFILSTQNSFTRDFLKKAGLVLINSENDVDSYSGSIEDMTKFEMDHIHLTEEKNL